MHAGVGKRSLVGAFICPVELAVTMKKPVAQFALRCRESEHQAVDVWPLTWYLLPF